MSYERGDPYFNVRPNVSKSQDSSMKSIMRRTPGFQNELNVFQSPPVSNTYFEQAKSDSHWRTVDSKHETAHPSSTGSYGSNIASMPIFPDDGSTSMTSDRQSSKFTTNINAELYAKALAAKSDLGLLHDTKNPNSSALEALRSYGSEFQSSPPASPQSKAWASQISHRQSIAGQRYRLQPNSPLKQPSSKSKEELSEELYSQMKLIMHSASRPDSEEITKSSTASNIHLIPGFNSIEDEDQFLYGDSESDKLEERKAVEAYDSPKNNKRSGWSDQAQQDFGTKISSVGNTSNSERNSNSKIETPSNEIRSLDLKIQPNAWKNALVWEIAGGEGKYDSIDSSKKNQKEESQFFDDRQDKNKRQKLDSFAKQVEVRQGSSKDKSLHDHCERESKSFSKQIISPSRDERFDIFSDSHFERTKMHSEKDFTDKINSPSNQQSTSKKFVPLAVEKKLPICSKSEIIHQAVELLKTHSKTAFDTKKAENFNSPNFRKECSDDLSVEYEHDDYEVKGVPDRSESDRQKILVNIGQEDTFSSKRTVRVKSFSKKDTENSASLTQDFMKQKDMADKSSNTFKVQHQRIIRSRDDGSSPMRSKSPENDLYLSSRLLKDSLHFHDNLDISEVKYMKTVKPVKSPVKLSRDQNSRSRSRSKDTPHSQSRSPKHSSRDSRSSRTSSSDSHSSRRHSSDSRSSRGKSPGRHSRNSRSPRLIRGSLSPRRRFRTSPSPRYRARDSRSPVERLRNRPIPRRYSRGGYSPRRTFRKSVSPRRGSRSPPFPIIGRSFGYKGGFKMTRRNRHSRSPSSPPHFRRSRSPRRSSRDRYSKKPHFDKYHWKKKKSPKRSPPPKSFETTKVSKEEPKSKETPNTKKPSTISSSEKDTDNIKEDTKPPNPSNEEVVKEVPLLNNESNVLLENPQSLPIEKPTQPDQKVAELAAFFKSIQQRREMLNNLSQFTESQTAIESNIPQYGNMILPNMIPPEAAHLNAQPPQFSPPLHVDMSQNPMGDGIFFQPQYQYSGPGMMNANQFPNLNYTGFQNFNSPMSPNIPAFNPFEGTPQQFEQYFPARDQIQLQINQAPSTRLANKRSELRVCSLKEVPVVNKLPLTATLKEVPKVSLKANLKQVPVVENLPTFSSSDQNSAKLLPQKEAEIKQHESQPKKFAKTDKESKYEEIQLKLLEQKEAKYEEIHLKLLEQRDSIQKKIEGTEKDIEELHKIKEKAEKKMRRSRNTADKQYLVQTTELIEQAQMELKLMQQQAKDVEKDVTAIKLKMTAAGIKTASSQAEMSRILNVQAVKSKDSDLEAVKTKSSDLESVMSKKSDFEPMKSKSSDNEHVSSKIPKIEPVVTFKMSSVESMKVKFPNVDQKKEATKISKNEPAIEEKNTYVPDKKPKIDPVKEELSQPRYSCYDCGSHWCQLCNQQFPSIISTLEHMHTSEHKEHVDKSFRPWVRDVEEKKEMNTGQCIIQPVKGIEFMSPVQGFYCALCKETFPDKLLSEKHLKGHEHTDKYFKFLKENPVYERRYNLSKTAGLSLLYKERTKKAMEEKSLMHEKRKKAEKEADIKIKKLIQKEKNLVKNVAELEESNLNIPNSPKDCKSSGIKLTLVHEKDKKVFDLKKKPSSSEAKPKPQLIYIGRAPNFKPRTNTKTDLKNRIQNLSNKRKADEGQVSPQTEKNISACSKSESSVSRNVNKAIPTPVAEPKKDDSTNKDSGKKSKFEKSSGSEKISLSTAFESSSKKVVPSDKDKVITKKSGSVAFSKMCDQPMPECETSKGKPTDEKKILKQSITANKKNKVVQDIKSDSATTKQTAVSAVSSTLIPLNEINLPDSLPPKKYKNIPSASAPPKTPEVIILDMPLSKKPEIKVSDKPPPKKSKVKNLNPPQPMELEFKLPDPVTWASPSISPDNYYSPNQNVQTPIEKIRQNVLLTEEEQDFFLLGINKSDMAPLVIPRPPPSSLIQSHEKPNSNLIADALRKHIPPFPPPIQVPPPSLVLKNVTELQVLENITTNLLSIESHTKLGEDEIHLSKKIKLGSETLTMDKASNQDCSPHCFSPQTKCCSVTMQVGSSSLNVKETYSSNQSESEALILITDEKTKIATMENVDSLSSLNAGLECSSTQNTSEVLVLTSEEKDEIPIILSEQGENIATLKASERNSTETKLEVLVLKTDDKNDLPPIKKESLKKLNIAENIISDNKSERKEELFLSPNNHEKSENFPTLKKKCESEVSILEIKEKHEMPSTVNDKNFISSNASGQEGLSNQSGSDERAEEKNEINSPVQSINEVQTTNMLETKSVIKSTCVFETVGTDVLDLSNAQNLSKTDDVLEDNTVKETSENIDSGKSLSAFKTDSTISTDDIAEEKSLSFIVENLVLNKFTRKNENVNPSKLDCNDITDNNASGKESLSNQGKSDERTEEKNEINSSVQSINEVQTNMFETKSVIKSTCVFETVGTDVLDLSSAQILSKTDDALEGNTVKETSKNVDSGKSLSASKTDSTISTDDIPEEKSLSFTVENLVLNKFTEKNENINPSKLDCIDIADNNTSGEEGLSNQDKSDERTVEKNEINSSVQSINEVQTTNMLETESVIKSTFVLQTVGTDVLDLSSEQNLSKTDDVLEGNIEKGRSEDSGKSLSSSKTNEIAKEKPLSFTIENLEFTGKNENFNPSKLDCIDIADNTNNNKEVTDGTAVTTIVIDKTNITETHKIEDSCRTDVEHDTKIQLKDDSKQFVDFAKSSTRKCKESCNLELDGSIVQPNIVLISSDSVKPTNTTEQISMIESTDSFEPVNIVELTSKPSSMEEADTVDVNDATKAETSKDSECSVVDFSTNSRLEPTGIPEPSNATETVSDILECDTREQSHSNSKNSGVAVGISVSTMRSTDIISLLEEIDTLGQNSTIELSSKCQNTSNEKTNTDGLTETVDNTVFKIVESLEADKKECQENGNVDTVGKISNTIENSDLKNSLSTQVERKDVTVNNEGIPISHKDVVDKTNICEQPNVEIALDSKELKDLVLKETSDESVNSELNISVSNKCDEIIKSLNDLHKLTMMEKGCENLNQPTDNAGNYESGATPTDKMPSFCVDSLTSYISKDGKQDVIPSQNCEDESKIPNISEKESICAETETNCELNLPFLDIECNKLDLGSRTNPSETVAMSPVPWLEKFDINDSSLNDDQSNDPPVLSEVCEAQRKAEENEHRREKDSGADEVKKSEHSTLENKEFQNTSLEAEKSKKNCTAEESLQPKLLSDVEKDTMCINEQENKEKKQESVSRSKDNENNVQDSFSARGGKEKKSSQGTNDSDTDEYETDA